MEERGGDKERKSVYIYVYNSLGEVGWRGKKTARRTAGASEFQGERGAREGKGREQGRRSELLRKCVCVCVSAREEREREREGETKSVCMCVCGGGGDAH